MKNKKFIDFVYRGQLCNLLNGVVSIESMEKSLLKYEKKEHYEVCEGIRLAIKYFKKNLD